jgi:hypothetical protein
VPEAQKAGVRIVLGDDYGIIVLPRGRYAEELEFYGEQEGPLRSTGSAGRRSMAVS